jgi:hypothetical protein
VTTMTEKPFNERVEGIVLAAIEKANGARIESIDLCRDCQHLKDGRGELAS